MTTKKKITRHEMREDQFVSGVFKFQEWAEENLNKLIIGGVVVIVVIGAIIGFTMYGKSSGDSAFEALGKAEVLDRTGQAQLAIEDYKMVLSKYGSSDAAPQAAFRLANLYFQSNDFVNAEQAYKTYLDKYVQDDYFRRSAKRGIAASLAGQAKYQEAAAAFLESAKSDTSAATYEEDLFNTVSNAVKSSDTNSAKEAYALLEKHGTTSERYRTAKIMMIEKGLLQYERGEFK